MACTIAYRSAMQLRFLEYFVAVARERHFGRAAIACHVSQPTLSAGLAQLEATVGRQLILRDRRFIDLTAEGQAMLPLAERILVDMEALRAFAPTNPGDLRGVVRMGCIPAAIPAIGRLVRGVHSAYPQLTFRIFSQTSREIERNLISAGLDVGVTYLESEPPAQVLSVPFYVERYVAAVPHGSALAKQPQVSLADLARHDLCLLHQGMQNRRILDQHLERLGVSVEPVATTDSYPALISLVADAGLAAILTDSQADLAGRHPRVRVLPIADPLPPNTIGLVVSDRDPLSPLAKAVLAVARRLARPSDPLQMIDIINQK
jgi:DNA-binding transcriptional LysR family regulator